ncbi:hypothetical protein [Oceanicaulis sp. MMSF_3324]|uniref:hypothetical protein n=1 Tax=Oceanicaulis sp. MMSF_3324 TaxID=3046702 RepID=UPI00273D244D|nr:hypothetical protein [Oceanicaulis sp. MMSF_3324]
MTIVKAFVAALALVSSALPMFQASSIYEVPAQANWWNICEILPNPLCDKH